MKESFSYHIAGHILAVTGDGVGEMMSKLLGFKVFLTEEPAEWKVKIGELDSILPFTILHSFDLEQYDCHYGMNEDVDVLQIIERDSGKEVFRMQHRCGDSIVTATKTGDKDVLRFALWFAFNLFAVPLGVMAIHSSTIVCKRLANLFLGESGTGKSTHTRLWLKNIEGSRLLNDDSPIISVENGRVMVYGSPWSGKTACYHNIGFPVNAFVRLRQEKQNVITKLNVFQAFAALQPSTPPSLSYSDFYSSKVIENLDQILRQVPVYQLGCLPNDEAAQLAYETIYKS